MRVLFPSLRGLTDDDAILLSALIGAVSQKAGRDGQARMADFLAGLRGALRAAPRPSRPALDALPDLDDAELAYLADEAGRLEVAHARHGWAKRAAFFADLGRAVGQERARRATVLASLDADMTWYEAHSTGRWR